MVEQLNMTPQERAEKIINSWHGELNAILADAEIYGNENTVKYKSQLIEAIRVAIVDATNDEVSRRREAEKNIERIREIVK